MFGLNFIRETRRVFGWRFALLLFVLLLVAELVLRFFPSLYIFALSRNIYFCDSDSQIQHPSQNSELVYEINRGNSLADGNVHALETKYSKRRVSVNSLGFRGGEFSPQKPDGVFRIIVLGGSYTYGVLVNDEDTYPAVMERLLNDESGSMRFEVINAGVCEYVLSQQSEYGLFVVEAFNPDLVILQVQNNGRRAFLREQKLYDYISINRRLMLENIPCALSLDWSLSVWHERLLWYSALYRSLNVWLNFWILGEDGSPEVNSREKSFSPARASFLEKVEAIGNRNGLALFTRFSSICCSVPIVFFDPAGGGTDTYYAGVDSITPDLEDKAKEYRDILPPSHVYAWYARQIIRELRAKQLIPE